MYSNPLSSPGSWTPPLHGGPRDWPKKDRTKLVEEPIPSKNLVRADEREQRIMDELIHFSRVERRRRQKPPKRVPLSPVEVRSLKHKLKNTISAPRGGRSCVQYLPGCTVLTTSNTDETALLSLIHKRRNQSIGRMKSKWKLLHQLHNMMRLPRYRKPGVEDLKTLSTLMYNQARQGSRIFSILRQPFSAVLQRMYSSTPPKLVDTLFSAFDPEGSGNLDLREFFSALRCFRNVTSTESAEDKLKALFDLYDVENQELLMGKDVIKLFKTCSANEEDKSTIQACVERVFGADEFGIRLDQRDVLKEEFFAVVDGSSTLTGAFYAQLDAVVNKKR